MGELTTYGVLAAIAQTYPDREALVTGDRRLTYAQLIGRANRLAHVLADAGLGARSERDGLGGHESHQHHVGLYLHNGTEYIEGMLGACAARAATFNVNYRYVADELRYLLGDAGTTALVYHARFAPMLADIRDELPELRLLLQVADDSGEALLPGAIDYEAALAAASDAPLTDRSPSPDDLFIVYTGGTTGMPKGVLWRQHDMYVAALGGRPFGSDQAYASIEALVDAIGDPGPRLLLTPPFMHAAGQWSTFNMFTMGGSVVLVDLTRGLDAREALRLADEEQVNLIAIVGDAFGRPLAEELDRQPRDLPNLLSISSGGAPLTAPVRERLLAHLPNIVVLDGMGSSETGIQMSRTATKDGADAASFDAGPDAVVIDETASRLLEPGEDEVGWLAQRGHVPLGYLGDAEKTARTFPVIDGIRYSVPGDRARLGTDGTIELLGRDSVTINSGGEKIFAEEVEAALTPHASVADVVVTGRTSERWGQEVVAIVELVDGAEPDEKGLLTEAARHIARYKLPKAFVFVDQVVRSPAGKADYRWAKAQAEAAPR